MRIKSKASAVLGRITWKIMAVFGSRWAKNKLAGNSGQKRHHLP